ncbi:glycosyltransferase family 2 protein [Anaeromicropila herbilytica]|uniref:Glycosyl transferase n=1 Tax=Anaeromicropila herbilytica TaxID=2785025 RepID=A0A7R7EI76_9FIRM|nr:glycosyltransferase [Anaeromicropila herbilytica]BCN29199.1 glycosyl transferase [Anaeromicropila herbilytica]
MKLLSIAVPCYNSQAYLDKCIQSLLAGGDEVEILIINDGSTDCTAQIAEKYACKYPDIVHVIHQENGGHGEAVNTGILNARGMYFKVVDSDDWVDQGAYIKILDTLRQQGEKGEVTDMVISNFVYENEAVRHKKVMNFRGIFPEGRVFTWNEVGRLPRGHYLLMHSVIYRTRLLRECGLRLPKHTFYVDNLFVYLPLIYVKTMYYVDVDFYRYYIGREDQSVNEEVMIKRIDQQIKVNRLMVAGISLEKVENETLKKYMFHYLEIVTTVTNVLLVKSGTKENLRKKKELWNYIKETDVYTYNLLRYHIAGVVLNLPGRPGRKVTIGLYKISQKVVGFN